MRTQTIYAYVSRGNIAVMPDPHDPRKSFYCAEDVAGLYRKKQVGRKREALAAGTIFGAEPCIYSSITTFSKGRPYYRGRDSIRLSDTATLEDVATILWNARTPVSFETGDVPLQGVERSRQCAFISLAALAACGHSTIGRTDSALHVEAGRLVALIAQAFGVRCAANAQRTHERLALGWGKDRDGAKLIRRPMVLVADHGITSSAFAARITASTGASLPRIPAHGARDFLRPTAWRCVRPRGGRIRRRWKIGCGVRDCPLLAVGHSYPGFRTSSVSGRRSAGGRVARSAESTSRANVVHQQGG
jgi:citrate synthase